MGLGVLDEDADVVEVFVREFDASDQRIYEVVHKMIECGQVEKLYLRKHGLRLTCKKDVLISRIKEHNSIVNGEGELKYRASSFVMNCKVSAEVWEGEAVIKYGRKLLGATDPQISELEPSVHHG
ncbi:zinc finger, CCCH-type, SAP domain protein [Artemisia annua]|uniref:Zinc finger, CCCH-type, SAP domain protein n=1 Tax=Artemisia annua TaxID=35608 RepID=A0A2U1PYI7_ARTAN|nr:zinc finger, CCCH-type, SAP domain protein [Artemisia annua]